MKSKLKCSTNCQKNGCESAVWVVRPDLAAQSRSGRYGERDGGHEKHQTFPLAKVAILTVILGLFAVHTSLIFTAVTQDFYSRITDMKPWFRKAERIGKGHCEETHFSLSLPLCRAGLREEEFSVFTPSLCIMDALLS